MTYKRKFQPPQEGVFKPFRIGNQSGKGQSLQGGFVKPRPIISISPESGRGIRHLRRDIETGGRWAVKKTRKAYGKLKTLKGAKFYSYMDDGFIRYNVVFQDGSMYTMSENPLSPRGLSKYIGNIFEDERVRPFGKKVNLNILPREVKKAIKLIAEE